MLSNMLVVVRAQIVPVLFNALTDCLRALCLQRCMAHCLQTSTRRLSLHPRMLAFNQTSIDRVSTM